MSVPGAAFNAEAATFKAALIASCAAAFAVALMADKPELSVALICWKMNRTSSSLIFPAARSLAIAATPCAITFALFRRELARVRANDGCLRFYRELREEAICRLVIRWR